MKYLKLGEVAEINPRQDKAALSVAEKVSFVAMADVSEQTCSIISEADKAVDEVSKGFTYFANGDVLLAKITPCFENGKVAIAKIGNEYGFGSTEFHVIRANSKLLDSKYLYFLLRSPVFKIEGAKNMTGSAGQKRVPKAFLESFKIPLPPLEEQKRIAQVLDKADRLRQKDRQLLQHYDQLLQSVFLDMFGDPVKNEKGWEITTVAKVVESIISGTSYGGEERELKEDELGVLKVSAVTSGVFNPNEFKAVPVASITKKLIKPSKGDLLFSRANTRELVAATCVVDADYPSLFLPDKLWKINLHLGLCNPYFFKYLLSQKEFRYGLTKTATGTSGSMLNISMEKLRQLELPLPDVATQNKFGKIVEKVESIKKLHLSETEQSNNLFQSLLQNAFKGELQLKAMKAVEESLV